MSIAPVPLHDPVLVFGAVPTQPRQIARRRDHNCGVLQLFPAILRTGRLQGCIPDFIAMRVNDVNHDLVQRNDRLIFAGGSRIALA